MIHRRPDLWNFVLKYQIWKWLYCKLRLSFFTCFMCYKGQLVKEVATDFLCWWFALLGFCWPFCTTLFLNCEHCFLNLFKASDIFSGQRQLIHESWVFMKTILSTRTDKLSSEWSVGIYGLNVMVAICTFWYF